MSGPQDLAVETGAQPKEDGTFHPTLTIVDRKAGRAWSGEGKDIAQAATEAVRKAFADRRAREYIGG